MNAHLFEENCLQVDFNSPAFEHQMAALNKSGASGCQALISLMEKKGEKLSEFR